MSYIPPALRNKQQQHPPIGEHAALPENEEDSGQAGHSTPLGERLYRHIDIHDYYAARSGAPETPDDSTSALPSEPTSHSTLNASPAEPGKLKYVVLFKNANPRWQSDGIIFVKSNIFLLPGGDEFGQETRPTTKSTAGSGEEAGRETERDEAAAVTQTGTGEEAPMDKDKEVTAKDTVCEEATTEIETTPTNREESTENKSINKGNVTCEMQPPENTKPVGDEQSESTPTPASSYSPDLSTFNLSPVAVFEEDSSHKGHFRFAGHHRITRLQFLAPYSQDTYRMLEQKFSTVDRQGRVKTYKRRPAAWETSMSHRWAVVKFEADEEADAQAGPPDISTQRELKEVRRAPGKASMSF